MYYEYLHECLSLEPAELGIVTTNRGVPVYKARAHDANSLVDARFGDTEVGCRSARPDAGILHRGAADPVTVLYEHSAVRQDIKRAVDGDGIQLN